MKMRISKELEKEFQEVSIKITEKESFDSFFRRCDPNVLKNLAKYNMSIGKAVTTFKDLKQIYKKDIEIRVALFRIIQNIEERLTGAIIQRIANEHPDFHLQSKNFDLSSRNIKTFSNVNKFILDLKIQHHYAIVRKYTEAPKDNYIKLEELMSYLSLGMKAKLIKNAKKEYKLSIAEAFNMNYKNGYVFMIQFITSLNALRNRVMHHDTVIDWVWKSQFGKYNIFEFIQIATNFTSDFDMSTLSSIRDEPYKKSRKNDNKKIVEAWEKKNFK